MALAAALDAALKYILSWLAVPLTILAPFVHPRILHLLQRAAAPLLACKNARAVGEAAIAADGIDTRESAQGTGPNPRAPPCAPPDGSEVMTGGQLLHRLKTNIALLHDLLTERQQLVAEEGAARPRGLLRWLRWASRASPAPPSQPDTEEQRRLEWALFEVRYCLVMAMAGNAGLPSTDPLVFRAGLNECGPVPGQEWLPPLPTLFLDEAASGHLELCLRQVLPDPNRCLVDAVADGKEAFLEALKLLHLMGSCKELVPILLATPRREEGADGGAASPSSGPPLQSLMEVLKASSLQAAIFKQRSSVAGLRAHGSSEDLELMEIALEMTSTLEYLEERIVLWHASGRPASADARTEPVRARTPAAVPASLAQAPQAVTPAPAAGAAPATEDAPPSAASQSPLEQRYVEALRPLQFQAKPILREHYFRAKAEAARGLSGDAMKKRVRRLTQEMSRLAAALPLDWNSSVFCTVDEERMDVLRAMIFPASDTPYSGGAFFFDIFLPRDYPDKPPKVHFLTTSGGTVRFNPNLYANGYVCLSLLGTWGQSWDPQRSTLLQVLVSLQSMVFNAEPFYNEPGFVTLSKWKLLGDQEAQEYNQRVRLDTLRTALLPAIKQPDPAFADVLKIHFRAKTDEVMAQSERWLNEAPHPNKASFTATVTQIKQSLDRLHF